MFPKTKPVSIGMIYKPSNQTKFLEHIISEFEELDLKNEHHILGDFNVNLISKGTCILNMTNETNKFFKELLL